MGEVTLGMNKILLIILVLLAGCKNESLNLEERVSYWENIVESNIVVGTNRSEIESWAEENNLKVTYWEKENILLSIVETIPDPSFVCSHWTIMVKVNLDSENNAVSSKVSKAGTCL